MTTTPWYRQRWPWILIGGPAVVVVACLFTAYLAIVSDDGLVSTQEVARPARIQDAGR